MLLSRPDPFSTTAQSRARLACALRRAVVLLLALVLAYAAWRGYRNPDLLLDLAAFRLC